MTAAFVSKLSLGDATSRGCEIYTASANGDQKIGRLRGTRRAVHRTAGGAGGAGADGPGRSASHKLRPQQILWTSRIRHPSCGTRATPRLTKFPARLFSYEPAQGVLSSRATAHTGEAPPAAVILQADAPRVALPGYAVIPMKYWIVRTNSSSLSETWRWRLLRGIGPACCS